MYGKVSMVLIKQDIHEDIQRMDEWPASHLSCFTPGDTDLGTHRIEAWVGPTASLSVVTPLLGVEP
jgi:hypothetical protein